MRISVKSWRRALLESTRMVLLSVVGGEALAFAMIAPGMEAHAQEAQAAGKGGGTAQVEDVVVTARDRAEKAQDVPLSLSAVGPKTTDRQHIDSFKDVIQAVPSFTPAIANPRTGANGLRGVTGISGGADGSEGDVGLIVDNVFYSYIGFSFQTLYDIDSIQIARGPQGTLLGKNTTTGAVIINTKAPSFEPETVTETTFGSRNLMSEKFSTTGAIFPDKLAYRISFLRAYQDGYLPNLIPNPVGGDIKAQDTNRWDIRGQLLGTFGDVTDRVIFEHAATAETNNGAGTYDVNYNQTFLGAPTSYNAVNAAGVRSAFGSPAAALAYLFPQYGSLIKPNALATNMTSFGPIFTHTNGISNELNWQIGNHTLTSVTAFRSFDFHPENSNGNYGINAIANIISGFDVSVAQYSQEVRLASPKGGPVDYTIGAYFLHEDIWTKSRQQYGSDAVTLQTANATNTGNYASNILNNVEADLAGRTGITTLAPFGQATYHYDDHASLTFGLRDSYEIRTASDTGSYFGGDTLTSPTLQALRELYVVNQIKGTDFKLSGIQRTNSISYLVNPAYKLSDNVLAYATVARGVKSGAANTTAVPIYAPNSTNVVGNQDIITKPEVSLDYEAGLKTDWFDRRLEVNADLYLNDIYNFQAQLSEPFNYTSSGDTVQVFKSFLGNIPQVRLAGAEMEGRYSPWENLWLNFAAAYNGARYVDYKNGVAPADLAAVNGGVPIDLSGQKVPGVTPVSVILGFNYEHSISSLVGHDLIGYVYGNQAYHSRTTYSLSPTFTTYTLLQSGYSIFNAGIGFKTSDLKYDLSLWGKNIFNRQAVTSFGQTASSGVPAPTLGAPYGSVTFVDPQTFGITLRATF